MNFGLWRIERAPPRAGGQPRPYAEPQNRLHGHSRGMSGERHAEAATRTLFSLTLKPAERLPAEFAPASPPAFAKNVKGRGTRAQSGSLSDYCPSFPCRIRLSAKAPCPETVPATNTSPEGRARIELNISPLPSRGVGLMVH